MPGWCVGWFVNVAPHQGWLVEGGWWVGGGWRTGCFNYGRHKLLKKIIFSKINFLVLIIFFRKTLFFPKILKSDF